jgi:hypothetical protein
VSGDELSLTVAASVAAGGFIRSPRELLTWLEGGRP